MLKYVLWICVHRPRKRQLVVLDNGSTVYYDELILACGLQFSARNTPASRKGQAPGNVLVLNDESEAKDLVAWVKDVLIPCQGNHGNNFQTDAYLFSVPSKITGLTSCGVHVCEECTHI